MIKNMGALELWNNRPKSDRVAKWKWRKCVTMNGSDVFKRRVVDTRFLALVNQEMKLQISAHKAGPILLANALDHQRHNACKHRR